MNAYIALLFAVVVLLSPVASAMEPALQAAQAPKARFIVVGPSAGEALRLLGAEPLVDAGELAAAILEPWQVSRLRSMGYSVALDPVVRLVEPNVFWGLQQASPQSYADLVNAGPLHQQGVTGGGVIVAVVDTGVDEARPELSGRQAWEYDATGTGQRGYCGKGLGLPYAAHGTMVAGIIFSGDSQLRGVAPDATLYDVIIARPELGCGGAYLSDIYNGILAAARGPDGQLGTEDDADVINLSFGTVALPWNWYYMLSPIDDLSAAYAELVKLMEELRHDYGINIVVAAGNAGPATSSVSPFCAAALCAGSVNGATGLTSYFSSRGPDAFLRPAPHVAAPGENLTVLVPLEFGSTTVASGTSFSAPLAAGTLALLRQLLPTASALDLEALLVAGGAPRGPLGWDPVREGGTRVDAAGAAGKLVAAAFLGEGFTRGQAQQPTAALWSGGQLQLRVVNLRDAEVTLVASAQLLPGPLAPGASGGVTVSPASVTLAPGEEAVLTVTGYSQEPGVAGVVVRLADASTGDVVAVALASLVEPLEPGERLALETDIYDWGFLPVPLRAPQPGTYSLDVYSYTLPVETVVWDGTGPDSTPATLILSGEAVAYLNPVPFLTAYPLAAITRVEVALSTISVQSLDDVYARLGELEARLDLLEARVDSLEAQLARLDALEDELAEVREQLSQAMSELEALSEAIAEQQAVNEEQWRAIREAQARLDSLEAQLSKALAEIEELRGEVSSLTASLNTLAARLASLQERAARLEAEIRDLEGQVAALSERLDSVEEGLGEANSRIQELERGLEEAVRGIAEAQQALAGLASDVSAVQEDLARLEARTEASLRELRAGLDGLRAAVEDLDSRASALEEQLAEASERLARAEGAIRALKEQAAEAERQVAALQESLASLEARLESHEETLAALEKGLEEARASLAEAQQSLKALQDSQKALEDRVSRLEEEQRSNRIASGAALALGAAAGLALLGLAARRLLEGA